MGRNSPETYSTPSGATTLLHNTRQAHRVVRLPRLSDPGICTRPDAASPSSACGRRDGRPHALDL